MSTAARTGAVRFLHYSDTGNIGDYLCSPRHYFDFTSDRSVLIVGGGASNNFFCGRARKQRADVRIAWGIGQSWTLGDEASPLDRLIKSAKRRLTYVKASTRDPLLAFDQLPLVPCVSVFHPVTEIAPGTEVGIFVNAHEQVSGGDTLSGDCASAFGSRAFVATNALAPDEFMRAFGRAGTIVTNSYHAAYWGLLSGRKVHIIGYSSKFVNLAALFGFPPTSIVSVDRGDGLALNRAIARCADRAALQLAAPDRVKSQFRKHNLDFARSLASVGVVASLKRTPAEAPELVDA